MLLDLVTPEQVAVLRSKLEATVGSGHRPKLAAWLSVAVDATEKGRREVLRGIAGYLTIGGYREMFLEAGFDEVALVSITAGDLSGERTLREFRSLA